MFIILVLILVNLEGVNYSFIIKLVGIIIKVIKAFIVGLEH